LPPDITSSVTNSSSTCSGDDNGSSTTLAFRRNVGASAVQRASIGTNCSICHGRVRSHRQSIVETPSRGSSAATAPQPFELGRTIDSGIKASALRYHIVQDLIDRRLNL